MRFNRKRIIAIVVFLLLSFFMITFGNPVENTAIVTRNVKFIDGYNDKLLAEKTVELGKAVTAPIVPKHLNYVFVNWYVEGTDDIANLDKIMADSTFIARYADDRNNNEIPDDEDDYYTVRFIDGLNNDLLKSQRVLVGLDATAPIVPTHEGYTFSNWDNNFENVTGNITVTGLFNINSYNLIINYNYARDNSKASTSYNGVYTYNSNYSVISPVIAGYTADKLNINGIMPASDQTLEVLYTANKDTAYKVEHYKQNLDNTYTLVQTDDMVGETDTLTAASGQTYEGYTAQSFDQLNIAGDGSTIVKIYYGRNSYELTYKVDGEIYTSITLKYGETIIPEVNPTRVGYTFSGWSTIPSVMPANNVEINGSFNVNKYFLKIYYQNEYGLPILMPYISLVNYGSEYNIISDEIAGYTVDKPVVSGTMPASHKIVFVTYVANRNTPYKIEYYKNNVLFETEYKTGTTDTIAYIMPDNNKYNGYYYDLLNYRNDLVDIIKGDGSTVLKVYYKASIYRITYNSNKPSGIVGISSTPSSRTYTVEDEFNITATMSSTSHNFMGWYANSSGTGSAITKIEDGTTGNKTLYAKWDIKKYTVTFNQGVHGELSSTSTPNVPYNSTFGSITKPLATPEVGYTFSGWNISNGTLITGNITATALYTANTNTVYKVEYYKDGILATSDTVTRTGTTDTTASVINSDKTKYAAYTFEETNINNVLSGNIAGDGSLVLKVYYKATDYSITYHLNDSGVVGASHSNILNTYNINTPLYTLENASSTSDNFDGWFTLAVGGTQVTTLAGGNIGNIDLYAHWSKKAYTVNFEENGGSNVPNLSSVYYGDTIAKPSDPIKTGFVFEDWYKEETLANKWVFATDTVTKDLTLYANYTKTIYNLVFNINDTGVVGAINPSNQSTYTITDAFTYNEATSTSHNFLGWYTSSDVKETGIVLGTTGDKEYYAHWSVKTYTITFVDSNGNKIEKEVNWGSTLTDIPPVTPQTGYTCNWDRTDFTNITSDDEVNASCTKNSYTLTVDANGGVWSGATPQTIEYEDTVTIADPTRTGYTFTGWTLVGTGSSLSGTTFTMGHENATLTANWVANSYTLTVNANGGTWSGVTPQTISYNDFVTIVDPARTGYAFTGWTLVGSGSNLSGTTFTMGHENATLTANWSERFTVAFNSGTHGTGTMSSIIDLENGDSITVPDCLFNPDSGYTFVGWKDQYNNSYSPTNTITVTGNLTLTAQWDLASVTFVGIDSFWTNKIKQWGPTSAKFDASMVNNNIAIQYFYLKGIASLSFSPNNNIVSVSEIVSGSEVPFSTIDPFTLSVNKIYYITVKTSGNNTQKIRVTVLPE